MPADCTRCINNWWSEGTQYTCTCVHYLIPLDGQTGWSQAVVEFSKPKVYWACHVTRWAYFTLWCIQHSQPWLQKATNYVYPPNSMERSDVRFRCHRSAFYQRCYLSSSLPLQYTYGVDTSVPYLRIWGGSGGVWWCVIQYDHDKGDERCRKESIQVRDMYMYYCIILHCIITAQILTHQSFLASSLPTLIGWYTLSFALVIK